MDSRDLLIAATETYAPLEWHYTGRCKITMSSGSYEVQIRASWVGGEGQATCDDPDLKLYKEPGGEYGASLPLVRIDDMNGRWTIPAAFVSGFSQKWTSDGFKAEATLGFNELSEHLSNNSIAATVLLLSGAVQMALPERVRPPGKGDIPTPFRLGLFTTAFGHPALLCMAEPEGAPNGLALALARCGGSLGERDAVPMMVLLALIIGKDQFPIAEVSVDSHGQPVSRRMWRSSAKSVSPKPAIPILDPSAMAQLGEQFDGMLGKTMSLIYEKDVPIDVAVTHLLLDSGGRLDLEIRDIVLALDTVVESPLFTPDEGRIVSPESFKEVVAEMKQAIAALPATVPTALRERLAVRIQEANATSHARRRQLFWGKIGFAPTEDEARALARRNPMSHRGFISPETAVEERALFLDVERARALVNRTFLTLLGYKGPLNDFRLTA